MMIWAQHNRRSSNDNITCPLCRGDFGPFNKLLEVLFKIYLLWFDSCGVSIYLQKVLLHMSRTCGTLSSSIVQGVGGDGGVGEGF